MSDRRQNKMEGKEEEEKEEEEEEEGKWDVNERIPWRK